MLLLTQYELMSDTDSPAPLPRRKPSTHMVEQLRSGADVTPGTAFSLFTPTVPAAPSHVPGDAAAAFRAGTGRGGPLRPRRTDASE